MKDKELMTLAAKAVGGVLSEGHSKKRTGETWETWEWVGPLGISKNGVVTHPLLNNGDALSLAIKLGISININVTHGTVCASAFWQNSKIRFLEVSKIEMLNEKPEEATRLAIVRAAAEIGKTV